MLIRLRGWRTRALLFAILAGLLAVPTGVFAQGGPPLQTDDPGTPGPRNWEINVGLAAERRVTEREFEAPLLDVNYGVGERVQLKFEVPWVVRGSDGVPTKNGLGNSRAGVKWRFYENKRHDLAISTYPQLDFNNPNHSVERDLAERGAKFLLPLEVTKKLGPVDCNVEVGYRFSEFGADEWVSGFAVGREVTKRIELLGEIYSAGPADGERDHTFDGGGRFKLGGPMMLLFMAGRSFRPADSGEPSLIGYVGLQFQINHRGHEADPSKGFARVNRISQ